MTTRKPNPVTGRYPLTAKNRQYKALVSQRRAEVAAAAKKQRKADAAVLDAAITRAEAAVVRARAAERGAVAAAQPTAGATEGTTPDDGQLGAQDSAEPPAE